jgi:UDP-GlcNAc:undecaprenyl-phosphate GlcNAc-1-phosphate transferase
MKADRSHVHHRLIDMGLSQKQAVAVLYVISAILGVCAVVLTTSGALRALIFLAAVVVAGLVVFKIYTSKNDPDQDTGAQTAEAAENSPGEPVPQEETPAEPEAVPSAPQDPPVGEDTEENNGCNQSE